MKQAKANNRSFFLHCDECHHEVDFPGKMMRAHIGFRCPECGADMLTEADYKAGARIQAVMSVLYFLRLMRPGSRGDLKDGEKLVRFHHHKGTTTLTELAE